MTSPSLMHEAGHSKPVLWDNPQGWDEEGDGASGSGWGDTCVPWLIHVDGWPKPPQYCKVISFKLKEKIQHCKKKKNSMITCICLGYASK